MDFPSTQLIADENESINRHNSSQFEGRCRDQVATLIIRSNEYPIRIGINTIGRHPGSDIPIADTTVSKHHCEIEATSTQAPAWICDLNSSNKTRLNNAVLRPGRNYELKQGSVIDFGRVRGIYTINQALNESTVPETPAADRRRKPLEENVVAATPDSSLNNSSGLAGDVSAIPATQDFLTTFRTPQLLHQQQSVQSLASTSFLPSSSRNDSLAEATSSTCDKNICPDSDDETSACEVLSRNEVLEQNTNVQVQKDFCPDSDDEAGASNTEARQCEQPGDFVTSTMQTACRNDSPVEADSSKTPTNCPNFSTGISIHDMETQKPEDIVDNLEPSTAKESIRNCSGMQCDIHDMETQIDDAVVEARTKRSTAYCPRNDSPDRDSACKGNTSIYDMETQKPEDIINDESEISTKKLSQNRSAMQCDIHDMETQKEDFQVNTARKSLIVHSPSPDGDSECENKTDIYDMETQKPEGSIDRLNKNAAKKLFQKPNDIQCHIHDMETQKEDFQANTARKSLIVHSPRNSSPDGDSECENKTNIYDMETQKPEASIDRLNKNAAKKLFRKPSDIQCNIHDMETQKEDFQVNTARKTLIVKSSRNDNSDSNSETENQVSIYDLETQKPLQQNGQTLDIDDMETQNLFLPDDACKDQANSNSRQEFVTDLKAQVETERISSPENQGDAEDIYDKETQCPNGIALMMSASPSMSSEKINAQDDKVISESRLPDCDRQADLTNDSSSQMETQKINSEDNNCKVSKSKLPNSEDEQTVANPLNDDAALQNNTNCSDKLDDSTGPPEERLKLSLEANFEEDCKELDLSVSNLGSQNLLENFTDAEDLEHLDVDSPNNPSSDANKELNQYAASSEEDDIFNAVTQKASADDEDIFNAVTQRVTVKSREHVKNAFESDDSETDEEGVFLNIAADSARTAAKNTKPISTVDKMICEEDKEAELRFNTCATQKIVMNESDECQPDINASDNDDSITDEEGVFTQFVKKVNDTAGPSSIAQENDNSSHSQDADDIYDLPTQPIKLSAEEKTDFSVIAAEDDGDNKELDKTVKIQKKNDTFNDKVTPTVVGKENAVEITELQTAYNIDDITPTQPIHASAAANSPKNIPSCYKDNESTTEIVKEKKLEALETESDIDDMAPTQLIRVLSNESPLSNPDNLLIMEVQQDNLKEDDVSSIDSPPCFRKNEGASGISNKNNSRKSETLSDIDDMAPTQIIRVVTNESPLSKPNNLIRIETASGNLKGRPSTVSPPCSRKNEGRFKMPTEQECENPKSEISSDINDVGPTQIIYDPSDEPPAKSPAGSLIFENDNSKSKEDVASDIDILPTQMIRIPKETYNTEDSDDPSDGYSSDAPGLYTADKCGIEDIDYEMAPTQLISDVEAEQNKKSTNAKKVKRGSAKKTRGKTKRKAKVNLDDTIERNLNSMFDEVNTEEVQEPPMLTTQSLKNVLQSSQEEKLSESTATTSNNVGCRNIVKESSNVATPTITENADSQNSENYFSTMTSTRKQNAFKDSQDSFHSVSNKCLTDDTVEKQGAIIDEIDTNSAREGNAGETSTHTVEQICNIENTRLEKQVEKQDGGSSLATCDQNNARDEVKNDEIPALSAANDDTFDEYFLPNISESFVRPSIIIDDDEVDIMAGLPEVRISGTSSYPPSPTSSVSNRSDINILLGRNTLENTVTKASRGRGRPRKTKQTIVPADSKMQSNLFSESLCVEDVPIMDSTVKRASRGRGRPRKTKETIVPADSKMQPNLFSESLCVDDVPIMESTVKTASRGRGRPRKTKETIVPAESKMQSNLFSESLCVDDVPIMESTIKRARGRPRKTKQTIVPADSKMQSNLFSESLCVDNVSIKREEQHDKENARFHRVNQRSTNNAHIKDPSSAIVLIERILLKQNSIALTSSRSDCLRDSPTDLSRSPFAWVTRSRRSSQENDDYSSVFQVAKQAQAVSGNSKAPTENSKRVSIGRKQSLPKKLENKQIDTKTPKEIEPEAKVVKRRVSESKEDMGSAKKARHSSIKNTANTRQSPSIRDFFPKRESPLTIERQESPVPPKGKLRNKKNVENTKKSVEITNEAIDSNPPEKSARRTRRKASEVQLTSSTSLPDDEGQGKTVKRGRRTKLEELNPIVHPGLSEESQEVEMIMSGAIVESKNNVQLDATREETPKQQSKGRRGRKRLNPNESKSTNKEEGNTSSSASASEQPSFEVPSSRPKRAKMSNVSYSMSDTSLTESSKKGTRSGRYSQLSLANSSTSSSTQSPSPSKTRQKVLFTGITNTNDYTKILTKLGASQVEEPTKCTVLVTDKVRRTVKFLCALAQSTPIVSVEWLVQSEQMGQFVDMNAYILSDKEAEKKFGFKLKTSLEKAQTQKLLDGYTIILTPNVAPPPIPDLKSIISACGGKPLIRPPTKWPEKAVIISNQADMANARKFLAKAPKEVSVQSTEFLLTGILQQQLNFAKFKLI